MMNKLLLASALSLLSVGALAQASFPSPNGINIESRVVMCNDGTNHWVPCTTANPLPVSLPGPYPAGSTPLTASATGTIASVTATLAAAAAKTTYLCGFTITSSATLGLSGTATVSGTISGSLNYVQGISALPGVYQLPQTFSPCIPASALNTSIAINSAAAGLGGVTAVSAWGYQL